MATSIPSFLRQLDLSQFAISRIALHNATASPALTISALPPSGFAVRSHTQERIEYVQDPEIPQESSQSKGSTALATSSTALSLQETTRVTTEVTAQSAVFDIPVLLLKVHSDQGFRLTFELEGRLVEQLSSTVTQQTGEQQQEQHEQQQKQQPQQLNTSLLDSGAPEPGQRENPPMDNAHKDTSSNEHRPPADTQDLANTFPGSLQAPDLFFAETSSEQELEDLCRESDFQSMLKEHVITTVEFPVIYDGTEAATAATATTTPDQSHESAGPKSHAWDWTYAPKDQVDDGLQGHKTVFAFLLRDASSGTVKVLSRFSFWIIDPVRPDQYTGPRYSISPPSPSTAVHRHWRRASTPEKLTSSMGRLTSFQSKLVSIPTSHMSLPSLPEAAAGATGLATGGVQAMSSSTATMAGDSSLQPSSSSNASPFVPETEDGPLFRATVVECENHIRDMKASTKRIIKAAQTAMDARKSWTLAEEIFIKELEGFKPAEPLLNAFMRPMAQYLSEGSEKLGQQMRNLLIEPLTRFYENDIKVAESYRKAFDDESKEYYTFLSRYMAMKQESNRKKSDADAKYEKKRRHFELKRFEYWGFLLDMRVGGSKSDEILHHLTNYSEKYSKNILELALLADELKPGLDGISADLLESQKRAVTLRRERHERRKELMDLTDDTSGSQTLYKSGSGLAMNSGSSSHSGNSPSHPPSGSVTHGDSLSDSQTSASSREQSGDQSTDGGSAGQDHRQRPISGTSQNSSTVFGSSSSSSSSAPASVQAAKFSGIRDLEHQDTDAGTALGRRKEGFLFATSRPSLHNNSAVLEKPNINWHKYWCVLAEGQLHEYSHWKKGATMPHNDPINLKISTVRACRNQDRRFCFEVITPKFRRVYQATSTEDMNSWIGVISNAIQSLLNGTSSCQSLDISSGGTRGLEGQNAGGRSSMEQVVQALPSGHVQGSSDGKSTSDYGSRKGASESSNEQDHYGSMLLQVMRESHPANTFCAECGAKNPDWCAINLGILICIECSGIHRSLGTHISKVRSFTLDTTSYTRDLFDFIRAVGNNVSNEIWEARLVQTASALSTGQDSQDRNQQQQQEVVFRKPVVNDGREYKVTFIQKKYVERAFVDKKRRLASEKEDTGTDSEEDDRMAATKLLFKAVVANDVAGVIGAFACGADLNAVEEAELDGDGGGENWTETSESNSVPAASAAATAVAIPEVGGDSSDSLQVIDEDSELVAHSPGSETSKSTLASSVLNIPGSRGSGQGRSSFRVMETSPLLLALRNGVPFSLDEHYEVYPMAEFMLQNGATSNLSVEVQIIDDELASNTSNDNNTAADGNSSVTDAAGTKNGWDSTQVDPEDIRHFQQRSNRRSLGQVVHMRGEGGVAAMEYLRGKSAARGESMPGSSSSLVGNTYGDSKAPIGSSSPPATLGNFSPRLRPQTLTVGVSSLSAPTSVVSSPSGPGNYSTTVLRGAHGSHATTIQQDIASLFQKRRVSDGGLGPAIVAAAKATEVAHDKQLPKDFGSSSSSQLQPAQSVDQSSSSAMSSPTPHRSMHGHGIHSSSSPHQHSLHASSSRAHKVKATLSKSLRLSAAYLKNNVLKEERDHHPMPVFSTSSQSSTAPASTNTNPPAAAVTSASSSETDTRSPQDNAAGSESEEPLSGPYVILNPRVKQ